MPTIFGNNFYNKPGIYDLALNPKSTTYAFRSHYAWLMVDDNKVVGLLKNKQLGGWEGFTAESLGTKNLFRLKSW